MLFSALYGVLFNNSAVLKYYFSRFNLEFYVYTIHISQHIVVLDDNLVV